MWEWLERREIQRRVRRPAGAEPIGPRGRLDLAPGTDMLPQIRHIVILMMENHSYDNYLGMLADRGEGLPLGPDGVPLAVNLGPNGEAYHAHRLTSTVQSRKDSCTCAASSGSSPTPTRARCPRSASSTRTSASSPRRTRRTSQRASRSPRRSSTGS